jgi:hypothetical protein
MKLSGPRQWTAYLPFHAASFDGKYVSLKYWDHHYAQQRVDEKNGTADGLVRVVNSVLTTSRAKVVLDAFPIPAETNEMGVFPHAIEAAIRKYGEYFDLVLYDGGAASETNMEATVKLGKGFLFCLADERWALYKEVKRVLGRRKEKSVQAQTEDVESKSEKKVKRRRLYIATAPKGYKQWEHVRSLLRICSQTLVKGVVVSEENHYYASSLEPAAITPKQWMALIRTRWGVENNLHWTLDTIFEEDDRPWIVSEPRGTVNVMLLRRIAYSILSLFRVVSLGLQKAGLYLPWKSLLDWVYDTLISSTDEDVEGLRFLRQTAATN